MKKVKKIISIMLIAVMAMAMSMTAFAAQTIPEQEPESDSTTHTYEIYQIFTGDYADGVLSNIKWGTNAKAGEVAGTAVAADTLAEIVKLEELSENARAARLAEYADLTSEPISIITGTGDSDITVQVTTPGYYLIKDVDGSQQLSDGNYALYMVKVIEDQLTFKPKVGVPTVDKVIKVDGKDEKDSNGAIGDVVTYEFTGTMPDNIDLYNTYFYRFTDTLSKGLEYNGDIEVKVDGADVTSYFYQHASEYNEVTGTEIIVSIQDIKALALQTENHEAVVPKIDKDTKVVVTYTATIRENAVVGNPGNPNKVDLEYSNNPNDSGDGSTEPPENPDEPEPSVPTGKTPESEVITYTTELKIKKVDENGAPLTGVEFTLSGENLNKVKVETGEQYVKVGEGETGTYYLLKDGTYTTQVPVLETNDEQKANVEYYQDTTPLYNLVATSEVNTEKVENSEISAVVGEDGYVTFVGLSAGEYTLSETKTPSGYNTINDITITISYNNGKFTVTSEQIDENNQEKDNVITNDTDNTFSTTIENRKGSLLPSTGGIGTTIFYIVGAIIVVGVGVILVTKKRMSRGV